MTVDIFPSYPRFKEIYLKDKNFLEETFKICQPKISEYTFTNLYVWREMSEVLVSRVGETLLIKRGNAKSGYFILPPIGNEELTNLVDKMLAITIKENFPPIYGIHNVQAESLKKKGFTIEESRSNWDYVYLARDLINLPGERYYVKRKNIKKCLAEYKTEYKPITKEIVDQCLQLQISWCNLRDCDAIASLKSENRAIKETFLHFDELNVFGAVILIEGKVEAFTIGERLNKDTAVIHFEKANPEISGLYQVINWQFCSNALQDFTYVNREQDLGVPGLRKAKMSYHPAFFIEKFFARATSSNSLSPFDPPLIKKIKA